MCYVYVTRQLSETRMILRNFRRQFSIDQDSVVSKIILISYNPTFFLYFFCLIQILCQKFIYFYNIESCAE